MVRRSLGDDSLWDGQRPIEDKIATMNPESQMAVEESRGPLLVDGELQDVHDVVLVAAHELISVAFTEVFRQCGDDVVGVTTVQPYSRDNLCMYGHLVLLWLPKTNIHYFPQ